MNKDYDPSEYMKKLRSHKVYRGGRLQLWASLRNMVGPVPWIFWPILGFILGVVVYYIFA